MTISLFDAKLVSVKFAGFALVLPTFNLGFFIHCQKHNYVDVQMEMRTWKSFFFSFFFF